MAGIAIEGLHIGRGAGYAAGPFDLELCEGEATIVTGPNGAGKSTLLRTLAGLLRPLAGRITVSDALAADGEPAKSVAEIAHYVGHRNAMKPGISVGQNLDFWADYLAGGVSGRALSNREALERIGLADLASLPYGYLSAGQQRRVSLARLLVVERAVWLLDEPTAALDQASQAIFAQLMTQHLDAGGILVGATHQPLGLKGVRELRLSGHSGSTPADAGAAGPLGEADLAAAEGWL